MTVKQARKVLESYGFCWFDLFDLKRIEKKTGDNSIILSSQRLQQFITMGK